MEIFDLNDKFEEALKANDLEELKKIWDRVLCMYINQGDDLGYYQAIMKGTWPSAYRQLNYSINTIIIERFLETINLFSKK